MNHIQNSYEQVPFASMENGSQGDIYVIKNKKTSLLHVLKLTFKKDLEKDGTKETLTEFTNLQQLRNCSHIIKPIDFVVLDNNFVGLITPLANGGTLQSILKSKKAVSLKSFVLIGLQLIKGVLCMHDHYIYHFDIKPSNIVLDKPYDDAEIPTFSFIDFGISSSIDRIQFYATTNDNNTRHFINSMNLDKAVKIKFINLMKEINSDKTYHEKNKLITIYNKKIKDSKDRNEDVEDNLKFLSLYEENNNKVKCAIFNIGTPGYQSPELKIYNDYECDKPDIYALGMVFHQLFKNVPHAQRITNEGLEMERIITNMIDNDWTKRNSFPNIYQSFQILETQIPISIFRPRKDGVLSWLFRKDEDDAGSGYLGSFSNYGKKSRKIKNKKIRKSKKSRRIITHH
jgi:serine/threonine protein kinase